MPTATPFTSYLGFRIFVDFVEASALFRRPLYNRKKVLLFLSPSIFQKSHGGAFFILKCTHDFVSFAQLDHNTLS